MFDRAKKWLPSPGVSRLLSPIATAGIAFALIATSTIIGTLVRSRMPEHHLTGDSKEVIRLATALVATLTGLVLALMFASTRTSFEHTSASVSRLAGVLRSRAAEPEAVAG